MLWRKEPKIRISNQQVEQLVNVASKFDVKPGSPVVLNVKLRNVQPPENSSIEAELAPEVPLNPYVINPEILASNIKFAKELEAAKREGLRKAMDFSDECGAKPAPMLAVALGSLVIIGGIAFLAAKAFKQKK